MLVNKCLLVILIVFAIIGAIGVFTAAICFLMGKFLDWRKNYYAKELVVHQLKGDSATIGVVEFVEDDDDEDDEFEEEEELVEQEPEVEYGEDELAPLDEILKIYK